MDILNAEGLLAHEGTAAGGGNGSAVLLQAVLAGTTFSIGVGNADGEESEVVPIVRFEAPVRSILPGPSLGAFHVGIEIENMGWKEHT